MSRRPSFLRFSLIAAISLGLVFAQTPGPAMLLVKGDIAKTLRLKAEDLAAMPREDGAEVEYEGVPLREVLKRAGAPLGGQLRGKALATYVLAKAHDGYQVIMLETLEIVRLQK